MAKIVSPVIFLLAPFFLFAQLKWQNVDSLYAPLPVSMHVFRTTDSPDGSPFLAYYVSASLKDRGLQFTTDIANGNAYTPDQFYQLEKQPLLIVNCAFFSFETNDILSLVIKDGKMLAYNVNALKGTGPDSMLYYYPTRSAIGIDRKRRADVAWLFTNPTHPWPYAFEDAPVIAKGRYPVPTIYELKDINWKWWKMRTAVGGGPTLIHNGAIGITNKEEQMFVGQENEKHPRTAIGYTSDNRLIILVIQGRSPGIASGATLLQEAQILKALGCYEALNEDGGGSSCMLINGRPTITPSEKSGQRPLPAVFLVRQWVHK